MDEIKLILGDCLPIMQSMADKSVDLCLCDPPYGIGADNAAYEAAQARIRANGKTKAGRGWKDYGESNWDIKPPKEYFTEMIRISKNQIIWGGNYFTDYLYPSMGWLVWDKGQREFSLADGELAWTSFNKALRIKTYSRAKALQDGKRHPTQKSLTIMKWCLINASKEGDIVLDPFLGSGTTGVAAKELGRSFIGIEIEPKYFEIAQRRINQATKELF